MDANINTNVDNTCPKVQSMFYKLIIGLNIGPHCVDPSVDKYRCYVCVSTWTFMFASWLKYKLLS